MSFPRLFLYAVLTSFLGILVLYGWVLKPEPRRNFSQNAPVVYQLAPGIHVRDQMRPDELVVLKAKGFTSVIDLRPDGEAKDQAPSAKMAEMAAGAGLSFSYVPTPHGDIPDNVVRDFGAALAQTSGKVLLYCRSGSRAARVWALAEAGRSGGSDVATITSAVTRGGFAVDDLRAEIMRRYSARAGQ